MKKTFYLIMVSMLTLASCGEHHPAPEPPKPSDKSLWIQQNDPVETISVYCGKTLVQTYEFEYDKSNLLTHMTRIDKSTGAKILDIDYTYDGINDMTASGFYLNTNKTIMASYKSDGDILDYEASGEAPASYSISMDSDNLPCLYKCTSAYDCAKYSAQSGRRAVFTTSGGDIMSMKIISDNSTETSALTKSSSNSDIEYTFTYSDKEDLQNFAAYLLPCELPLWVAAELPGCKHLITGMTCKRGNVTL